MTATGIKRFVPRFSLRTLVVFMLLVTSGAGLWWNWGPWYVERQIPVPHLSPLQAPILAGGGTIIIKDKYTTIDVKTGAVVKSEQGAEIVSGGGSPSRTCWVMGGGEGGPRNLCFIIKALDESAPAIRLRVQDYDDWPEDASISPDGNRVVTVGNECPARIWDAKTGRPVAVLGGPLEASDQCFMLDEEGWYLYDTRNQFNIEGALPTLRVGGHTDIVDFAAWSSDGRLILTGSHDGTARLWNASTAKCLAVLEGLAEGVTCSAFSPDGALAVTVDAHGAVRAWEVSTGKLISALTADENYFRFVAFPPDGDVCLIGGGEGWSLWNASTGEVLHTFDSCGKGAAYTPDGTRIVTLDYSRAVMWDAATGRPLCELGWEFYGGMSGSFSMWHKYVLDAVFSPDGGRLVLSHLNPHAIVIWHRRRPEWWWGIFWLWEFWLTAAFAALFVWSVWRDRRVFRHPPSPQPSPPVGGEGDSGAAKGGDA